MAAHRSDQAGTGVAGAMISTPEAQAIPRPGRYRGLAGRYLDMTMEVRCVRT